MSKTITGVMPIRTVGLTPGHRWCGELRSVKPAVNNGKGARGLVQGPNSLNASCTHPGRISGRPRKLASDLRNRHLVEALVLDLIGPIHDPARATERLDQSPSRWYLTGFLVPRDRPSKDLPAETDEDDENDDLFGSEDDPIDEPTGEAVVEDDADKSATTMTGKRQILPSSMGLSMLVPSGSSALDVLVRWGDYHPELADDHSERDADPEPLTLQREASRETETTYSQGQGLGRVPRQEKVRLKLDGVFERPRQEPVPKVGRSPSCLAEPHRTARSPGFATRARRGEDR